MIKLSLSHIDFLCNFDKNNIKANYELIKKIKNYDDTHLNSHNSNKSLYDKIKSENILDFEDESDFIYNMIPFDGLMFQLIIDGKTSDSVIVVDSGVRSNVKSEIIIRAFNAFNKTKYEKCILVNVDNIMNCLEYKLNNVVYNNFINTLNKFVDYYKNNIDNIVILDVETNGGHKIIQIAYKIYNAKLELLKSVDLIINNGNCETDYFKKFTESYIRNVGLKPNNALNLLDKDLKCCSYIVCHNIAFDVNKLIRYSGNYNMELHMPTNKICTMKSTTNLLKIPNKNRRGYKYPKLEELYQYLLKKSPDSSKQHNASYDVDLTFECFKKLVDSNHISL